MIELAPSFPRGYCRAGTCYLLQGDAANARRCFEKGLECARSQPEERARAEECERRLREVKEVEEKMNAIQHAFASTNQVLRTIRALLALKDHCPNWRELYVQLIHCYLLVGNTASARIALNRVTPNIDPFLSSTSLGVSLHHRCVGRREAGSVQQRCERRGCGGGRLVGAVACDGGKCAGLSPPHPSLRGRTAVPRRAEILPIIAAVFVSGALASECGEGE